MQERQRVQGLGRRAARLVWRYARAHPGPLAVSIAAGFVYAVGVVAGTVVLGEVTDRVILPALREGSIRLSTLVLAGVAVVGVALFRAVGVIGRRFFGTMAAKRYQVTLREQLARHYLAVDLAHHRNRSTGDLLTTLDNDVERTTEGMTPLPLSASVVALGVAAVASLVVVDPVLALVALALIPTLVIVNHRFGRRMEGPAAASQQRLGELGSLAHESFDGAMVVKTLGREAAEVERFEGAAARLRDARLEVARVRASFEPLFDLLPTLAGVAVVAVGAWRVTSGAMTTGQLVQAVTLFSVLTFPLRVLGFFLESVPMSVVSLDRVDAVLAEGRPLPGPARPRPLPDGPLGVEVRGVSTGFGGAPALADVSFAVEPGEVVALVGPTGSGKTTLCELLVRLADPQRGRISIGGVPLQDVDPADLRRRVALVFQEPFVFADTVMGNITGADDVGATDRGGATDRDEATGAVPTSTDVTEALRIAQAETFVAHLPRGPHTVLGERGVTLSGGQRQRVALARALARRPGLLILDDATSAIDPLVEARILAGLRRGRRGGAATLVVVAHRLSTIRLADRVLFLDGGHLVGVGSHDDLLRLPGYAALARAYERGDTEPVATRPVATGGEG